MPPNVWKTLTHKQQELYKKALKAENKPDDNIIKKPTVNVEDVPRSMQSKKTTAFDSVDHLESKIDKIGEDAGNIWKPKPRSLAVKKSEQHYASKYNPQVKTTSKIPEATILQSTKMEKRDITAAKIINEMKISKKPKIKHTPSLIEYIKKTTTLPDETPRKCMEHKHIRHQYMNIVNPPRWNLKPILADEFCLYFEEQNIHVPHVTIYDPDIHAQFNLNIEQAMELYPEAIKEYSKKKLKMYYKTILPAEHHHQLIIDCGADTSGIGGPEWIIDEMTNRYVDISGYNNIFHDKKSRIGSAITAIDLPDNKTILIKINEATILNNDANSLLSTTQASYYGNIINCIIFMYMFWIPRFF